MTPTTMATKTRAVFGRASTILYYMENKGTPGERPLHEDGPVTVSRNESGANTSLSPPYWKMLISEGKPVSFRLRQMYVRTWHQ